MSRPSPNSEHDGLARKMRESCVHMLEDAAAAGLLAPLYLLIAQALSGLFLRLADMLELWRAGKLPLPAPREPNLRRKHHGKPRASFARSTRARRPAAQRPDCVRAAAHPPSASPRRILPAFRPPNPAPRPYFSSA